MLIVFLVVGWLTWNSFSALLDCRCFSKSLSSAWVICIAMHLASMPVPPYSLINFTKNKMQLKMILLKIKMITLMQQQLTENWPMKSDKTKNLRGFVILGSIRRSGMALQNPELKVQLQCISLSCLSVLTHPHSKVISRLQMKLYCTLGAFNVFQSFLAGLV